jgi:hypothetical protein
MRNIWLSSQPDRPYKVFTNAQMAVPGNTAESRPGNVESNEYLCRCGCKLAHNYSISRITEEHGERHVQWYRHLDHRNRHAYKQLGHV